MQTPTECMHLALVFQFLYQLNGIFKEYFGKKYTEVRAYEPRSTSQSIINHGLTHQESIRDNFTLVYELLDETMDYGYPQNCSIDVLKMYINLGSLSVPLHSYCSTLCVSTNALSCALEPRPSHSNAALTAHVADHGRD